MEIDWTGQLAEQVEWHWREQLRPRLDGLTDEEYFWEPGAACWNVRPRGQGTAPISLGSGDFTADFGWDAEPPPVTTIAWRLAHVIMGCFGVRVAAHFDGPPIDYETFPYAGTAQAALDQLDEVYGLWTAGVRGLDAAGLARPCGPAEGPYAEAPLAALVLHINREVIHHGAE